jgi:hypothetical protein
MGDLVIWVIVVSAVCGAIGYNMAWRKNRPGVEGLLWGALLGVIGVIVVALLPAGPPRAPAGANALACPRCNAPQNVPKGVPTFECWQCKQLVGNPFHG